MSLRYEVWQQPQEIRPVVMSAIKLADVVKFSEEELLYLTETSSLDEGLTELAQYSIPLVLITLGENGALAIVNGQQHQIDSIPVNVVDTTGAGDAFVSGLLAFLSQNDDWQQEAKIIEAVRWGNVCGALATTKKGAMSALPDRSRLLSYLGH
ncbi:belongs to the carbohydrate kinase PfkB family [Vibrio sp. B1ASS3]|nr:belongs to the carbohydrate kinase PfkB family [Vibrio sp. B1ASS3]CAE6925829.1 belongs to the carbohydrate kinase PfkB family [Vibrio sp. B1ASS3]